MQSVQKTVARVLAGDAVHVTSFAQATEAYAALATVLVKQQEAHAQSASVSSARSHAAAITSHQAAIARLREAAHRIRVPRSWHDFDDRPVAAGALLDDGEFEGWAEQYYRRLQSSTPDELPLPTMISLLDSLARYHAGEASMRSVGPRTHPLHTCAGVAQHWHPLYRRVAMELGGCRYEMASLRALADKSRSMSSGKAAQSLKSICLGCSDGGAVVTSLLAGNKFYSTLVCDQNTDALLGMESTLRDEVDSRGVRAADLRFRTTPRTLSELASESSKHAAGGDTSDSFTTDFDLAVHAPPPPPLLPTPLLDDRVSNMRYGQSTRSHAAFVDAQVLGALRPSGGHMLVLASNLHSLGSTGVDDLPLDNSVLKPLASWTPQLCDRADRITFESWLGVPDVLQHELVLDDAATTARQRMLGCDSATSEVFSTGALLPSWAAEAYSAVSADARALCVCVRVMPRRVAPGRESEEPTQRLVPGTAFYVSGRGPEASQGRGAIAFRDTYEYERYLPKGGPANARHWTATLPQFDFLDDLAVHERRAAADRARQRKTQGDQPQWPREADGQPLTPHANRATALRGTPAPLDGRADGSDALADALERQSSLQRHDADAATTVRTGLEREAARLTVMEPTPLAEHLFSQKRKDQRRAQVHKRVLTSPESAEWWMDKAVRRSTDAQLSAAREITRAVEEATHDLQSHRRRQRRRGRGPK